MSRHHTQQGFTIIELMVATAIFAVVLLICTFGLLNVGRMYYRGVTTSRTQETARVILDDIAEAIKFNGGNVVYTDNVANGWMCVGDKRYTWQLNTVVADTTSHALVADIPASGCTGPQPLGGALAAGSVELLGNRMRLVRLNVQALPSGAYKITVRILTGDNGLVQDVLTHSGLPGSDTRMDSCLGERNATPYCAMSELTTIVSKRV
jgi:prepilin-type N-terminal cleavage/methylation domain-containing protein